MGKIVALGEVVADIYRGESTSEIELPFTARPGGAPANVAVAAARLGEEAAFAGSVGKDLFGDFILRALEAESVDATGAGDAFFAAALVHLSGERGHLSDEDRVREATMRGSAAGALACTDYGAMRALPTKDGLEQFMAGGS